jgi:hypothetical protein
MPLSIFWVKQLEKKQRKNIKTPKMFFRVKNKNRQTVINRNKNLSTLQEGH